MSKDDSAIKDDRAAPSGGVGGIQCESSPPTPRSLRLERVAQALARSSEELQQMQQQGQRSGASAVPLHVQPPFVRYLLLLLLQAALPSFFYSSVPLS
jgi:hypothetical protein